MAWEILKSILKNSRLLIQPIEIGLNPSGNTKFHFREIWGEPRWQRLITDAAALNLKMCKPEEYVSGINAARAIEAYGQTNAEDYISSVFKAVFLNRVDISIPNSLRLHLQADGIDSSILAAAIEDSKTAQKANDQSMLWGHERIRMLPTIEAGDERYCGFIDRASLERYLRALID